MVCAEEKGVQLLAVGENHLKRGCAVGKGHRGEKIHSNHQDISQFFTNALWERNPVANVKRRMQGKLPSNPGCLSGGKGWKLSVLPPVSSSALFPQQL